MVKDILASHEERMKKSIEALKHEFASLRAGRATPSLLDKVMVNYYGAPTPVNQIAKVSVPEPRMIMIQPWEKSILHDIEVAIMKSDLGLSPNSDGTAIRLSIPALTQERRQELVKTVNKKKPKTMAKLADIWYTSQGEGYGRGQHYNGSRYHMLNLHATFTKGTVEFRLFQFDAPSDGKLNGLHAGQLKSYIQLCLALSQMAKEVRSASAKPQQNENPKYAMRTWLLRLGFIGEEFATARDILTRRLSGDAAFRSGRPA